MIAIDVAQAGQLRRTRMETRAARSISTDRLLSALESQFSGHEEQSGGLEVCA
jgi:hypothetical protein